jgi:putative drug exporter of the RND superfamily
MFPMLGKAIARLWPVLLAAWGLLLAGTWWYAPAWDTVAESGEIAFLPADCPSLHADALLQKAFPGESTGSTVVLILVRDDVPLQPQDKKFVHDVLAPALNSATASEAGERPIVSRVRTLADPGAGALLLSGDKRATLVVIELATPFLDRRNVPVVERVEDRLKQLGDRHEIPDGLRIALTGSATAGRDLQQAEAHTAQAVEAWTIGIVIVLLILMYRAPLVALIPLLTVFVSVQVALYVLAIMAGADVLTVSRDTRVFITVLAYGAGVDYCLFLIARFREEQERGAEPGPAAATAVARVGGAIAASAATVIGGIAMLAFARFGKIHAAGLSIPVALCIVLCASLTFCVSLLCLAGRWAFWPQRVVANSGAEPARAGLLQRLLTANWFPDVWRAMGPPLVRWPWAIWFVSVAALAPFAVVAVSHYHDQNYNPISDLPERTPNTVGIRLVEQHFPSGILGTITVLLHNDNAEFGSEAGVDLIAGLTDQLRKHKEQLDLVDIRTVSLPLGFTPVAKEFVKSLPSSFPLLGGSLLRPSGGGSLLPGGGSLPSVNLPRGLSYEAAIEQRAIKFYVSHAPDWEGHVTRLDLMLGSDPVSREGIDDLDRIESFLRANLPTSLRESEIAFSGPTATVRDFADVKQGDETRIELLVPAIVFVLLVVLLRRVVISVYLVLSVLFSYLAALGVTYLLFAWLNGEGFVGLDWKVPIFLFTILVAVGEDYNIFLVTRIKEEQAEHGPLEGITTALAKTGRVISNCGLLMAGTFASLWSSDLAAMKELGFALAFGILLDTLVIRPILVPTFLVLLESGRLGRFGKYVGLRQKTAAAAPESAIETGDGR